MSPQAPPPLAGLIENFRYIFANSRDMVNLFSLSQNTVLIQNDAAFAMLGYSREEFEAKPVHGFYPPEELGPLRDSLMRVAENGYGELQTRMYEKSGELRDLWIRSFLVQREPELIALVHTIDISHEKQRERQALHASKLAVLGEISAILTHEIGSGLQTLASSLALIRADAATTLSAKSKKQLDAALASLQVLETVSRNVQKYSASGAVELASVAVPAVVNQVLTMLEGFVASREVEMTVAFDEELPMAEVDERHLHQILLILAKNAVQAMEGSDRRQLSVTCRRASEGIRIELRDTGPGLPAGVARNLFEPFKSVGAGAQSQGLGLSIAKKLADENRLSLSVESSDGIGTTFTVLVPSWSGGASLGARDKAVLVFADQTSIAALLRRSIEAEGGKAIVAATVGECLQVLATARIDLIICDHNSYPISGAAFLTELSTGKFEGLMRFRGKVAIVAAEGREYFDRTAPEAGIRFVIPRAPTAEKLAEFLRAAL